MSFSDQRLRRALRSELATVVIHTDTVPTASFSGTETDGFMGSCTRSTGSFVGAVEEGEEVTITGSVSNDIVGVVGALSLDGSTVFFSWVSRPLVTESNTAVTFTVKIPQVFYENRVPDLVNQKNVSRPFLVDTIIGSFSFLRTIGPKGRTDNNTAYQFDMCYQINIGSNAIDRLTDALRRHFWLGRSIVFDGQRTAVRSVTRGPALPDGSLNRQPFTLYLFTPAYNPE